MTYELLRPVTLGKEEITQFELREIAELGDVLGIPMARLQDPWTDDYMTVIGRLSGQPDAVLRQLSIADFQALSALVAGFLVDGLPTSDTAPPSSPQPSDSASTNSSA